MCTHIGMHDVARIEVTANGCRLMGQGTMHWWQKVILYDSKDRTIGEITLHLANADVALPIGEQPPYWGIDPRQLPALVDGEVAPF